MTIYFDFDGVYIPFVTTASLEEVGKRGYSLSLPVVESIKNCVIMLRNRGYKVAFMTAILNENAKQDKKTIISQIPVYGDELVKDSIFVEYGISKASFLKKGDILIDDFTKNLNEWENAGGIGIKVYNGINGNHGTWTGYSIHSTADPEACASQLYGIISQIEAA